MSGNSDVVGAPGRTARLDFVVDVVDFHRRDAKGRADLRRRLGVVVDRVVADLGLQGEHDEVNAVCLPEGVTSAHVLPRLISAMTERVARDNQRHHDRMRLRMAIGTGELTADLHQLVRCAVLRDALAEDERSNLAVLLTSTLHDEVIRPGYLAEQDFTAVEVTTEEVTAAAWLRLC